MPFQLSCCVRMLQLRNSLPSSVLSRFGHGKSKTLARGFWGTWRDTITTYVHVLFENAFRISVTNSYSSYIVYQCENENWIRFCIGISPKLWFHQNTFQIVWVHGCSCCCYVSGDYFQNVKVFYESLHNFWRFIHFFKGAPTIQTFLQSCIV